MPVGEKGLAHSGDRDRVRKGDSEHAEESVHVRSPEHGGVEALKHRRADNPQQCFGGTLGTII